MLYCLNLNLIKVNFKHEYDFFSVEELTLENEQLHMEVEKLNSLSLHSKSKNQIQTLQKAIRKLEHSVMVERQSHNRLVEKLKREKEILIRELEKVRESEKQLLCRLKNSQNTRYFFTLFFYF